MSSRPKPKLGQYRHTSARARRRRRFPYRGVVFLLYGLAGAGVCALVSLLLRATGLAGLVPERYAPTPLPPAPGLDNILFGAGLPETLLACSLVGFWIWSALWNSHPAPGAEAKGPAATLPALLGRGLLLGPLVTLFAFPIGVMGMFIRAAPAAVPWFVRPFLAPIAAVASLISALFNPFIPLVLIFLGLLLGAFTAVAVACLWPYFPEETAGR